MKIRFHNDNFLMVESKPGWRTILCRSCIRSNYYRRVYLPYTQLTLESTTLESTCGTISLFVTCSKEPIQISPDPRGNQICMHSPVYPLPLPHVMTGTAHGCLDYLQEWTYPSQKETLVGVINYFWNSSFADASYSYNQMFWGCNPFYIPLKCMEEPNWIDQYFEKVSKEEHQIHLPLYTRSIRNEDFS